MLFTGAHAEVECPNKRVITRTDVLKINEQNIDSFEHFRRWLAMFAVQAINWNAKPRMLVALPFDHVVLRLAEKSVLRTEEGCDLEKIAVVLLENTRRVLERRRN